MVSRTGYTEKDMASYDLQNFKADAVLIYRLKNKTDISYAFRIAHTNIIYHNTPQWIYNISFGNPSLFKSSFGFNINYRWQSEFLWQSSLATGRVPAYGTVDAQIQYTFLKSHLNLKLGGSNLFNKYYYSFIGGPKIGGLYYCTATIHVF